jgi:Golgi phosphoprotein 3 (GPP34)
MSAGLSGTGLVADDLYLMAHNDQTGRPLLKPRPLGIGLAGGLLAELMLGDSVSVGHGGVAVPGSAVPGDLLGRHVLGLLAAEPELHTVREWLLFLARSAVGDVAVRLGQAGYVRQEGGRFPWSPQRWVPVHPDWAYSPLLRVRSALDPARPLFPYGSVLAGLAGACGLGFRMAEYVTPASRGVEEVVGQFGPGLQHLLTEIQTAVDSAVLAHRA